MYESRSRLAPREAVQKHTRPARDEAPSSLPDSEPSQLLGASLRPATGRISRRRMRPSRAGADPGPTPGPRITCLRRAHGLRSVDLNLPATPVGASSRPGRLRFPVGTRTAPARSGALIREEVSRRLPRTRGGDSFRLPSEMEPASDLQTPNPWGSAPWTGAGRRAPGRPASSWEPAWRPCPRWTAPPAPARSLPACALQIESLPEALLASDGRHHEACDRLRQPETRNPQSYPQNRKEIPAPPRFLHTLSTPDVLVGITRRPASGPARQSSGGGQQPCSTITRQPASSLARSSPGAASRGDRS